MSNNHKGLQVCVTAGVCLGLQVSSSSQVKANNVSAAKRPNSDDGEQPERKRKATAAACFWTGVDELLSSEDEDVDESPSISFSSCGPATVTRMTQLEGEDDESPSSSCGAAVAMTTLTAEAQPEQSSRPSEEQSSSSQQPQRVSVVDLSSLSSPQQLESLGLDALKEELMSRGLKCGGTLTERAVRLFSVLGLTTEQIDPALLSKPGKKK
ncbi:hypothetical protein PAMP_021634 [Pampus punctatissimus]